MDVAGSFKSPTTFHFFVLIFDFFLHVISCTDDHRALELFNCMEKAFYYFFSCLFLRGRLHVAALTWRRPRWLLGSWQQIARIDWLGFTFILIILIYWNNMDLINIYNQLMCGGGGYQVHRRLEQYRTCLKIKISVMEKIYIRIHTLWYSGMHDIEWFWKYAMELSYKR